MEASLKKSDKLITMSFLCFLSFPAFANHPDYEVYKLVGSVVVSLVVTFFAIRSMTSKSIIKKGVAGLLVFAVTFLLSFMVTYISSL